MTPPGPIYRYRTGPAVVAAHATACPACGRIIVVQVVAVMPRDQPTVSAACGDCVAVPEGLRAEQPEAAGRLAAWLAERGGEGA